MIRRMTWILVVGVLLVAAATASSEAPKPEKKVITNSNGMKLVLIPAGEFMMGSPDLEKDDDSDEGPVHRVRITRPFYLGITEVTQEQYRRAMGVNPSKFRGPTLPVESVSWNDAVVFCRKLSAKEGKVYRLPTEAEWEYACRAGATALYGFGDDPASLGKYAWYTGNSARTTHPVGWKKPNAWGLSDMHGNVWEWCSDWYDSDYYATSPTDNPTGPTSGSYRLVRGGGWNTYAGNCRSAYRFNGSPDSLYFIFGFRVACSEDASSK